MTDPSHFVRLFEYDDWANDRRAAWLHTASDPPHQAIRAYAHILAARRIWLGRLSPDRAYATDLSFEPGLDLTACDRLRVEVVRLWRDYLHALTAERLLERVTFHDSFGNPYTILVRDMLTHVLLHSAHHRGQIAMLIRMNGVAPGDADFYLSPMAVATGTAGT